MNTYKITYMVNNEIKTAEVKGSHISEAVLGLQTWTPVDAVLSFTRK